MSAIGSTFDHIPAYRIGQTAIGCCIQMISRRAGVCKVSGKHFKAGEVIAFNKKTGEVAIWKEATRVEQVADYCRSFHVCYWAMQEAGEEGRAYSDRWNQQAGAAA